MAHARFSAFSPDNSFLAVCGEDGKLKIYETLTNRLKQEYVPNLHLSSPCSAITWIKVTTQSNNTSTSPWKKRKRKSASEDAEQKNVVVMGSVNGTIYLYDMASASVSTQLIDGHNSRVTALAWSSSAGLFTAAEDKYLIEWNLHNNSIKSKWKAGKVKITAMAILSKGESLLTADRMIKWWDLSNKQLMHTFTGHSSQITSLKVVKFNETTSYLFSCSTNDTFISVWSLNEVAKEKCPNATLTTQDEPLTLSVDWCKDNELTVLTTTRVGQAHLFKYKPSETHTKPCKPTLTVIVLSDSKKESVQQIPIILSDITSDDKLMLAYGSFININFEKIVPDFSDKTQCLVRSDVKKIKERKEETLSKIKVTDTESNVEYLIPGANVAATKRKQSSTGSQLPLKDRLENLSLDDKHSLDKAQTKSESMVHLLIQGLQSKEKNILENVLYTKKENVIANTIAKLPVQAVIPLLKELTTMLQGKTYASQIATLWLKALITTHAGQLMSHPDVVETLTPILNFIDVKLKSMLEISKLRGRVNLITGQILNAQEKQNNKDEEEALLVYQDSDSSDEDTDIGEAEISSESDDNWEELSNLDAQSEDENCKSDDNESMCS